MSPKVRISKVMTPVAMPSPSLPNNSRNKPAAITDAATLTILLAIKIVMTARCELAFKRLKLSAPLKPWDKNKWTLIRDTLKKATSVAEKKAESASKTAKNNALKTKFIAKITRSRNKKPRVQ